jgi:glycopeptide antibiotics resistance protein
MRSVEKKFLAILPVVTLGFFYLRNHYETYNHLGNKRLLLLGLTFFLFYGWIFLEILNRRQNGFLMLVTQASFYVYVFMVLTLTGYFILFREVSTHDWWHKVMVRISRKDHVNLELFQMFKIYKLYSKQVLGNFIMLAPLGFFLPLLYKRISNIGIVAILSLLVSVTIELLQLITSTRSADVDDIFLNTSGACTGFLIYRIILLILRTAGQTTVAVPVNR